MDRVMKLSEHQYHDILGFSDRNDTPQPNEITTAYKKMALLTHPDKCKEPNANAAFIRMLEALSLVSLSLISLRAILS